MSNRALLHLLRPFEAHLSRPSVTEIVINEVGRFGVEDAGVWSWHEDARLTFNHLDAMGVLAGFISNREFSPEHPLCSATLPAGERIMCPGNGKVQRTALVERKCFESSTTATHQALHRPCSSGECFGLALAEFRFHGRPCRSVLRSGRHRSRYGTRVHNA